ncbi:MAG: molybdenum ABC transporter ATP-binding protein [Shimia sp.]
MADAAGAMIDVSLRHRFPGFTLDAAFTAPAGVTVLYGPSGCGKTSIVRAIAGLLRAEEGHVHLGSRILFGGGVTLPPERRGIGYVFQDARLFPHLTVRQNLHFAGRFGRRPAEGREGEIVDLLEIAPLLERRPSALSGGETSRVALARALLSAPDLLCLDEPLAALDTRLKAQILPYLERLRDAAMVPMIYVTHDIAEVARLGDTLVLLRDGCVERAGPVADILADPLAVPLLGPRAAGVVLEATVAGHEDGLTTLAAGALSVSVPRLGASVGTTLRLRIAAGDIILATQKPQGLSANTVVRATLTALHAGEGPGIAVGLNVRGTRLLARITRSSAERLCLRPGMEVWAIVKAVAFDPSGIGTPR